MWTVQDKGIPPYKTKLGTENQTPLPKTNFVKNKKKIHYSLSLFKGHCPSQEAEKVPVCFYKENGILMRKWRPIDVSAEDDWRVVHQIVVPKVYHTEVISLAHDHPMAGHLGISKTHDRILSHFWWPTLRKDVTEYCKKKILSHMSDGRQTKSENPSSSLETNTCI